MKTLPHFTLRFCSFTPYSSCFSLFICFLIFPHLVSAQSVEKVAKRNRQTTVDSVHVRGPKKEVLQNNDVNTEPIESYLSLTASIQKTGKADEALVKQYFNDPIVQLYQQRPGSDSAKFVQNLSAVYASNRKKQAAHSEDEYQLMLKYKENDLSIRKSIAKIKETGIASLVKNRLRPFYPSNFNFDAHQLTYVYLFLDEGNGGLPGYVFNSALQTSYLADQDIAIITAHEAYHSITNSLFINQFKKAATAATTDSLTNQQNMLWYLEIVAEEGIADLIDKEILYSKPSELRKQLVVLYQNEEQKARQKIIQLDSLLSVRGLNFMNLNTIMQNGGHIPGRYMARQIKKQGLLPELITHTGNPFQFIYLYNQAVSTIEGSAQFSPQSIQNLKTLEAQLLK